MSGFYTAAFHSDRASVCLQLRGASTMELELLREPWAGRCPLAGTVCQQEQSDTLLLSATAGSAGLASGLVGLGCH